MVLSIAAAGLLAQAANAKPTVVVAVHLQSPDFLVNEMTYHVLFLKTQRKFIPLEGYDFGAALADELVNALTEDGRAEWRYLTPADGVDVASLWDDDVRKTPQALPDGARRIMLIDVVEYGAYVADLSKDKFFIKARLKLIDCGTGKRVWQDRNILKRIDLPGKLDDLQLEGQKGLKEGINDVLEQFCREVKAEIAAEEVL